MWLLVAELLDPSQVIGVLCGVREECSDYVMRFELRDDRTVPAQHAPLNSVPAPSEKASSVLLAAKASGLLS